MNRMSAALLGAVLALLTSVWSASAGAAFEIFTCEPEWGALARELGGERVNVHVATTAMQDPHRIEARPGLIARARTAQLVVCTGAELETGWLPLLQTQSANPAIQSGKPGYFEAAAQVDLIEKPQQVDRAQGDVHAAGNPHVHLDPRNIARIASALGARLAEIDPDGAGHYRVRTARFLDRWRQAIGRWEAAGAKLKGVAVVVHHKDTSYLLRWLGMREVGALEAKPGIPPTATHLSELLAQLKQQPARLIVRSGYSDPRPAQWLADRARLPVVVVPFTVGGSDKAKDLFGLFDDTLERLLTAVR